MFTVVRFAVAPTSRTRDGVLYNDLAFIVLAMIGFILIGVLPIWPFSRGWGYGPAVVIGIVLLMLLAMTPDAYLGLGILSGQ